MHNQSFEQFTESQEQGCDATIVNIRTATSSSGQAVFDIDGSALLDTQRMNNRVYEASGVVDVDSVSTTYKGFFPEKRIGGLGIIVNGLGGFLKSSEALGLNLALGGLPTLLFDPVRVSQTVAEDFTDPHEVHVRTIEAIYKDLAQNRMITTQMPDGKDVVRQPMVLLPHSMGGLSAPRFALDHPDDVESLILLETIISGREVIKRIAEAAIKGHFIGSGLHEFLPHLTSKEFDLSPKNLFEAIKYFGIGNPKQTRVTKTLGEVISCVTADMRPYLKAIKEETNINIMYIDAEHDVLVRPGKDIGDYVHKVIVLRDCGHWSTQFKSALVAQTILRARRERSAAA